MSVGSVSPSSLFNSFKIANYKKESKYKSVNVDKSVFLQKSKPILRQDELLLLLGALCLAGLMIYFCRNKTKCDLPPFKDNLKKNMECINTEKINSQDASDLSHSYLSVYETTFIKVKKGIKKQINALSDGQDVLSGDLERVSYADMERWSDNPNLRCTGEGGIYYKDNSWWFGSDIADGLIKIEQNLSDSEICLFEKGKKCKKIYYIDKKPYLILDYSVPNVHEKYISVYPNGERIVNEILDWTNPQLEVDYYKYAKEISQNGKFKKCDLNAVKNTNNVFLYNGERMNGVYKLKPSNPYSDFCINEYSNGDLIKTVEYSPFAFPLRMQEIQDDKYLLIDFNSENHSFRSVKLYTLV